MRKISACYPAGCLCILISALAAQLDAAPPDGKPESHSFQVAIVSELQNKIGDMTQKIEATADIRYAWKNVDRDRILTFNQLGSKALMDGKLLIDNTMSRDKFIKVSEGMTTEIKSTEVPERLRKMLQASFGEPLCKVQRDADGKEVKRTIMSSPDAKVMIDNGMIVNALLFHPPYYAGKAEWQSDSEISMGNGGTAKGKLHYKKAEGNTFQVAGVLSNDEFKMEATGLTLKNAKYIVEGSQRYDPAMREWVAGKMDIKVGYEMALGTTNLGTASGIMKLKFERIKPQE